jgi:hypothetical protein
MYNTGVGLLGGNPQQPPNVADMDSTVPTFLKFDKAANPSSKVIFKSMRISPVGGNANGQYPMKVQIPVKTMKGFVDPWSVRLKVTVDFTNCQGLQDVQFGGSNNTPVMTITNRVNQLDGNALSLLKQFMWTNKSQFELEKVSHCDIIGRLLSDINYGPLARFSRVYEGNGGIISNGLGALGTSIPAQTYGIGLNTTEGNEGNPFEAAGGTLANDVVTFLQPTIGPFPAEKITSWADIWEYVQGDLSAVEANTLFNYAVQTAEGAKPLAVNQSPGYFHPCIDHSRLLMNSAQYTSNFTVRGAFKYNQTPLNMMKLNQTLAPTRMRYISAPFNILNPGNLDTVSCNNPEKLYQILKAGNTIGNLANAPSAQDIYQMSVLASPTDLYGFQCPFRAEFGCSGFEPMFSNFPQMVMSNGAPSYTPVLKQTFLIPLPSGILGIMNPKRKLIPLSVFDDLFLEVEFDPYAFFTSTFTTNNTAFRMPAINLVELWMDICDTSNDAELTMALNQVVSSGIVINTISWWNICDTPCTTCPKEIQINQGFKSLKSIVMMFYSTDYLNCTAARKHFRLSQSITSFQVKIGTLMYPTEPIIGNSGSNTSDVNNHDFMYNLLRIFGKHITGEPTMINSTNFAIDYRDWDWAMVNSGISLADQMHPVYHTPFFCENQIVGKAAYGLDFDTGNYEGEVLTGINTFELKPFTVMFGANISTWWSTSNSYYTTVANGGNYPNSVNPNSRKLELYGFGLYDLIIVLSPMSTNVNTGVI